MKRLASRLMAVDTENAALALGAIGAALVAFVRFQGLLP